MENKEFDAKLADWAKHHDAGMKTLQGLIATALDDLESNFQMRKMQAIFDTLAARRNTTRHDAFCKWIANFLPLKLENEKLRKADKMALEMNWNEDKATIVAAAKETFFMDFVPVKKVENFGDPISALKAMIEANTRQHKKDKFDETEASNMRKEVEDALKGVLAKYEPAKVPAS